MSKEKNFISAVIYVHNAENVIGEFLENIIKILEQNFEHSEIICVNDFSADHSVDRIKDTSKTAASTTVSLLNMSCFHGLEIAMGAGVDLAIGDFVFEFDDAVLDFGMADVINVYNRALLGYDVVSALPNKKQKISSNIFYYIFNRFAKLNYNIHTERFRILSRRVINRISSMNKTIPYRKAIYANCGLRVDTLQYEAVNSPVYKDADKAEKKYRLELAADSLILFTDIGYNVAKTMAMIMVLATLFVIAYATVVYLAGNPVEGWTTTILFMSFCFCGLFVILTFAVKYLQILVNLVFKLKKYSFESIEKITK